MTNILRLGGRFVRVTAVLLAFGLASIAGLVHLAAARTEGALLEVGRHLSAIGELGDIGARTVALNGQPLGFRVATTPAPTTAVLDHFEAWCRGGSGAFTDEIDAIAWIEESRASEGSWRDLTVREQDGERGFVACIRTGPRRLEADELARRAEEFAETGNLSNLGRFHYAYVEPALDATRVVAVWTAGEFYPAEIFPDHGDAPGADVSGVPRPPTGRRVLSFGEVGQPYELTSYIECQQSVAELVAFYRERLPRHGWQVLADTPLEGEAHSFVIERGSRLLVVVLGLDDEGERFVTIASASGDNS